MEYVMDVLMYENVWMLGVGVRYGPGCTGMHQVL